MKIVVISSSQNIPRETELITSLFENGLEIFHVHKPGFSEEELNIYLQTLPEKFRGRIFLHHQFPKFHSLDELKNYKEKYDYAFLSPIFDSISKKGYQSKFNNASDLRNAVSEKNIIALGGIDEDKIEVCRELDFSGIALCGAIWENENPLQKFLKIKSLCSKSIMTL